MPDTAEREWRWLVERPHPWRRQLWVRGRKLLASTGWLDAFTNGIGATEAAAEWDFSPATSEEIFAYCDAKAIEIFIVVNRLRAGEFVAAFSTFARATEFVNAQGNAKYTLEIRKVKLDHGPSVQ